MNDTLINLNLVAEGSMMNKYSELYIIFREIC